MSGMVNGLFGQSVYFNKTFYVDTLSMLSVAVKPLQNGYLIAGGYNAAGGYSAFYVRRIDSFGDTQWITETDGSVQESSILFGNCLVDCKDGSFVMAGRRGVPPDTLQNYLLVRLDEFGNTIWRKEYVSNSSLEGNAQVIKAYNGGYLLAGWSSEYSALIDEYGPTQFYIIKTDEAGNSLWSAKYGIDATLLYAEQTNDGGYILSGYRHAPASGYDMYVVKTDSLGVMQWEQTYGTDENDGGCKVFQLSNGNYVLMGLINGLAAGNKQLYFARLDTFGNVMVDAYHVKNNSHTPGTAYISPNDEIFAVTRNYGPTPTRNTFTKFSHDGEKLLEIPITAHTSGEEYIRDIEPTPDGGFVLAGFTYSTPQKSWVVKVDSLGRTCSYIGCDSTAITSITPQAPGAAEMEPVLAIFPNPAHEVAQLHYRLPPGEAFAVLELYDPSGKKVSHRILPAYGNKAQLDVSGLPSGIYLYSLITADKTLATGKLAVY